ncbi:hypothetical protein [Bradyrhizobium sp. Tv2a-2]|uniref:hypothetical protein n=1 Tax=Bradyrhizobium sp. Tv2a-2 TaxID=113395 RepID=UPI000407A50F|nr:hypothetical protein [Bradyrhizobium sp. Tv2a-2]
MFRDGTYNAWFRTARGQGTAIVHLAEGKISGGDAFFAYGGTYEVDGDNFTATLTTKRFADGPTTVLGIDEVELKLTGKARGPIACCTGTSAQAPDLPFEATLFIRQAQGVPGDLAGPQRPMQPEPQRSISSSNIARLPQADRDRYRPRNPFPSGKSR